MNILNIIIIQNDKIVKNSIIPKHNIEWIDVSDFIFTIHMKSNVYIAFESWKTIENKLADVLLDILKYDGDSTIELYKEISSHSYLIKYVSYNGSFEKQIAL